MGPGLVLLQSQSSNLPSVDELVMIYLMDLYYRIIVCDDAGYLHHDSTWSWFSNFRISFLQLLGSS